jgi:hypothetical protein
MALSSPPAPPAQTPAPAPAPAPVDVALEPVPTARASRRPLLMAPVALAVLVAMVVAAAAFTARGDQLSAPVTWAQVAARTEAAGSARIEVSVQGPGMTRPVVATGAYDFDARIVRMEMDLGAALRSMGEVDASPLLSLAGPVQVIIAADAAYLRMPLLDALAGTQGRWVRVDLATLGADTSSPWQEPAGDPGQLLDLLRAEGVQVVTVGPDTVRGVATTHSRASLDVAALAGSVAGRTSGGPDAAQLEELRRALADADTTVTLDVWVDDAGRVRRLSTTVTTPEGPATVTLELFDFGATVDTSVPRPDQVIDLADLEGSGLFGR